MARLNRNKEGRGFGPKPSKLHWLVWLNVLLTTGLYVVHYWR